MGGGVSIFLVGVLTAIAVDFAVGKDFIHPEEIGDCASVYEFINKNFVCSGREYAIEKTGYAELRARIETHFELLKKDGTLSEGSAYFRDLDNGPTFNVSADAKFAAASLLKLPLAIAFYALETKFPGTLRKKVFLMDDATSLPKQLIPPKVTIEKGKEYGIEDLIYRMIVYSDNRTAEVLRRTLKNLSPDKDLLIDELYQTGLISSENSSSDFEVTVRQYAGLFRLLFNISYLSAEDSEKLLSLLSLSEFKGGLVKGVPEGIKVAHKFGERENEDAVQTHDCGIVYFPQNPYLLCVMTRGNNIQNQTEAIADVSEMVWKEVDSRKIK